MASSELDRKILVAVDFGTTFSGLAWTQTRKPEIQTPIIQWPDATSGGLEGITSDKVPTEIRYTGQDYRWGFQIEDQGQRHMHFKLSLNQPHGYEASALAKTFPDLKMAPTEYDVSGKKMVIDYLTALREHAEMILQHKLPKGALRSTPVEFIITVPAIWSDAAQAKTRACAEQAGMGKCPALHIISEPEAAAIYALDAIDPHNVQIGDTFVLCDAGGGTVDLISYTVSALKPILEIAEASVGSGSLCGSSFLNRVFRQFLEGKLGKEWGWDEDVLEEAMNRFEITGVRRGRITISCTDMKNIFNPVIDEVINLVKEQIEATKKPVKAILLVGGFGQSAYLRDSIRHAVGDKVEVMQSPNGWTAVVRGAVVKGLASMYPTLATVDIRKRVARKHYGTSIYTKFDAQIHYGIHRRWSSFEGYYYITAVDWFIEKGSAIEEDKPVHLSYQMNLPTSNGHPGNLNVEILAFSDPENTGPPIDPQTMGVSTLVKVTADISRIPLKQIPIVRGVNKKSYYDVHYQIEVAYYSARTKFELVYKGVNYGPVHAEYV